MLFNHWLDGCTGLSTGMCFLGVWLESSLKLCLHSPFTCSNVRNSKPFVSPFEEAAFKPYHFSTKIHDHKPFFKS